MFLAHSINQVYAHQRMKSSSGAIIGIEKPMRTPFFHTTGRMGNGQGDSRCKLGTIRPN